MEAIHLIQVTPVELTSMIVDAVKMILQPQKQEECYMKGDQVAEYLGITTETLRQWKKAKKVTAYSMEGIVRYKKSEIEKLLKPLK